MSENFLTDPETPGWPEVYQIEIGDRVKGGTDGIANRQAKELVERTAFLKKRFDSASDLLASIPDYVQGNAYCSAVATGTADDIVAVFNPAISYEKLKNFGINLAVRAISANATTTPTFTPAAGVIERAGIVKGAGLQLAPGDIAGEGYWMSLRWDPKLGKWVLLNPATGVSPTAQQASTADVAAEAQVQKYISPDRLAASPRVVKAWAYFDGTSATPVIKGSLNIASITKNGAGDYTLNFSTPMADLSYVVGGQAESLKVNSATGVLTLQGVTNTARSTAAYRFQIVSANTGVGSSDVDCAGVNIFVLGR